MAASINLALDPWQERLLASTADRILINTSRQTGKSTMTALVALHTAMYTPRSLVLLLAPSQRQAAELMEKVQQTYGDLGSPVPHTAKSALRIRFVNGSRVIALPGKDNTIRGYSAATLLVIDEAAWVPDSFYHTVRPMLAVSHGRLIAPSTPFGKRGWWYEAWDAAQKGTQVWDTYEVPATDCPRLTKEFLAEELASKGEWWFSQEYLCQFLDSKNQAFRTEDVERALDGTVGIWDLLLPDDMREADAVTSVAGEEVWGL
jgi:hypothetical protein